MTEAGRWSASGVEVIAKAAGRWLEVGRSWSFLWARGASALLSTAIVHLASPAMAEDQMRTVEAVVVTATGAPVPDEKLPAMISVVSGQELVARGANDLRSALASVSGVEAPPGGDAGPASAVPSLWGLHEFDAFLLVVDGVPWGGAFNPAIATLDLNTVTHVEVLKGAAPVTFGQTAFVGVVQVFHAEAGEATPTLAASAGDHDSFSVHGAFNLPPLGDFAQSISAGGENQGFADASEKVRDVKGLYRLAGPFAGGDLGFDLDVALRRDRPQSPTVREAGGLTLKTPLDANFNPADGRLDENRLHGVVRYAGQFGVARWETVASLAYSEVRDVRGFLRPSLIDDGQANADSLNQRRRTLDGYFDTRLVVDGPFGVTFVAGVDTLYGVGHAASRNGEYFASLNGSVRPPSTASIHTDEINRVADTRAFSGEYVQLEWSPDGPLGAIGGVRVNETDERKRSSHIDANDPSQDDARTARRAAARVTGSLGATYRVWRSGPDHLVAFADYRNTGQPATIDFGPDHRPDILKAERAQIFEAGLKGALGEGRLTYDATVFRLDFKDLVVSTTDVDGLPVLENAGGERLEGIEAEARYHAGRGLELFVWASRHDAVFTHYVANEGGLNIDVSGKALTLSPHWLAASGAIYSPPSGLGGSLVVNYVGQRWLDLENTASTRAYATLDASLSYQSSRYSFSLVGSNLTNRRDAVSASEFGDQSFYRLPGRKIMVGVQRTF